MEITLFICTSIDGKITGNYGELPESKEAVTLFKQIGFQESHSKSYHFQGWLYGTNTALEFAGSRFVEEEKANNVAVPEGDYLIHLDEKKYFIAFDRKGVIGWQSNITSYAGVEAHVLELLTETASPSYRAYLVEKEIPYLIVGEEEIDLELALDKLERYFHLTNLLLGGGGYLNWSFLKKGLVSEISLLTVPAIDNQRNAVPLFHPGRDEKPLGISCEFKSVEVLPGNTLWIRYLPSMVENL